MFCDEEKYSYKSNFDHALMSESSEVVLERKTPVLWLNKYGNVIICVV